MTWSVGIFPQDVVDSGKWDIDGTKEIEIPPIVVKG